MARIFINYRLVLIEWLDSHHSSGWTRDPVETEPMRCRSVGWLQHDGMEAKTIVSHLTDDADPEHNSEMTIPTFAVVSIKDLLVALPETNSRGIKK